MSDTSGILFIKFVELFPVVLLNTLVGYLVIWLHADREKRRRKSSYLWFLIPVAFTTHNMLNHVLISNGMIEETDFMRLINKVVMSALVIGTIFYIKKMLYTDWYRVFPLAHMMNVLAGIPGALFLLNFKEVNPLNNMISEKLIEAKEVPVYLLILFIYVPIFFLIYGCSLYLKKKEWLNKIPKQVHIFLSIVMGILVWTPNYSHVSIYEPGQKLYGHESIPQFVFFAIVMTTILIGFGIYFQTKLLRIENTILKEQNQLQFENYKYIKELEGELYKIHHDIGNHIHTAEILIESNNHKEAKAHIEQLKDRYHLTSREIYCNNLLVNAILVQKARTCLAEGIDYKWNIKLPLEISISDIDLVSIFANLLDNGIEACRLSAISKPYIKVTTNQIGDYMAIKVENSKRDTGVLKETCLSRKKDKKKHGFGLKIVDDIVNRYDGKKDLKDKGDSFEALILLKIKEDTSDIA